jgi:histidyl-tRNA synthetase
LIGESGHLADVEIVALAADAVRAFGLGPADVRIRLSDRRLLTAILEGLGVAEKQAPVVYQVFDKLRRTPEDVSITRLGGAGIPAPTIDRLLGLARARNWSDFEPLGAGLEGVMTMGAPLQQTMDGLGAMGFGAYLDLDLTIVRGLAYYTGTVFELFDAQGELRAICGGGRYDNLLQSLGGVDLPALGFGMGDVVLGELLRDRGLTPDGVSSIDVFLAAITREDVPHLLALATELRDGGLRVEYALAPQAVGKQLKLASARGARLAVVVGPDDRARGAVMVKDLQGNAQESVARGLVRARVAGMIGSGGPAAAT